MKVKGSENCSDCKVISETEDCKTTKLCPDHKEKMTVSCKKCSKTWEVKVWSSYQRGYCPNCGKYFCSACLIFGHFMGCKGNPNQKITNFIK